MKRLGVGFHPFSIVLILLMCVFTGCSKEETIPRQSVPIKTETIKVSSIEDTSEFIAKVDSVKATDIYPRVSGLVEKIYVTSGQFVKAGDILMTLDASDQEAAFASAQANTQFNLKQVKQNESDLKSLLAQKEIDQSNLDYNKKEFERYKTLYEKEATTAATLDSMTNEYKQSQAKIDSMNQQIQSQNDLIESKRFQYKQSAETANQQKALLDFYIIRASFDGYVGDIVPSIGEYVTPNYVLTSLTDNSEQKLEYNIDLKYNDKLKKGLKVRIYDFKENLLGSGKINFISPKIDETTQTKLIHSTIDSKTSQFEDSELVKAQIIWDTYDGITIPTESIVSYSGMKYAFIVEEKDGISVVKQTPIEIKNLYKAKAIIIKGLKEKDILVTSGVEKLKDGMPVSIIQNGSN